ncbi:MAG: polyprenyl diphosphate synthase [Bacteroidales bacterium]
MEGIPKHVTIIMDGNGRWAEQRGLKRLEGHKAGIESVKAVAEFAAENRIEYLSLFAFSEENWSRPQGEIEGLMQLMVEAILNEQKTLMNNGIRFRAIGNMERLQPTLVEKIEELESITLANSSVNMIVFLSYSGKWDIEQAARRYCQLLEQSEKSNQNRNGNKSQMGYTLFESLLSTNGIPDPDLLIRTSGEQRLSNYLLWQSAYTELYFTDTLWPDFRKVHFETAIEAYAKRDRRYGKIFQQSNKIE